MVALCGWTWPVVEHSSDVHPICPQQNVAWLVIRILLVGLQQSYDTILHVCLCTTQKQALNIYAARAWISACRGSFICEIQRWQGCRWGWKSERREPFGGKAVPVQHVFSFKFFLFLKL